jgi:hypothetical protein
VPKKLRCRLLCEDNEQERFFRPILERSFGRIKVEKPTKHGGASFVLQRLPDLATYIRQHHQEAVGLLVVIDGDTVGYAHRLQEIAVAAGLDGAHWEKKIAKCIPCRSIETWEMWLCGARDLDEQTSYKATFRQGVEKSEMSARVAVEAWFKGPEDRQAEEARLPALAKGRKEIDSLRVVAKT